MIWLHGAVWIFYWSLNVYALFAHLLFFQRTVFKNGITVLSISTRREERGMGVQPEK